MQKKLTITIDEEVYSGLYDVVGSRNISQFIESLVRPHVVEKDLEQGYMLMARDEQREKEAMEWIEGTMAGVTDEERRSVVGGLRPGRRRRNPKAKAGSDRQ